MRKRRAIALAMAVATVAVLAALGETTRSNPTSDPDPALAGPPTPDLARHATFVAQVATIAADNCGKPYFGTMCR